MKPGREHSGEEFLQCVLCDSTEDLIGVFEVLALADAWYPDWPLDRRLRLAEDTVMRLLTEGLITLWYQPRLDDPGRPIPLAGSGAVLRKWRTWFIPDGVKVWLFATEKGEARDDRAHASSE